MNWRHGPPVYLWPEGGPKMRCIHCGRRIEDPNDGTWNEDIHKPAHKLCANSVPFDYLESLFTYEAPLNFTRMVDLHGYLKDLRKHGNDFTKEQMATLRRRLYCTATWCDERGIEYPFPRTRAAAYAARFLAILDGRLGPVERTGLARKRPVVSHGNRRRKPGIPSGDPDRIGRRS